MTQTQLEGNYLLAKFMGYTYPDMNNEVFKLCLYELHNYSENGELLLNVVDKISLIKTDKNIKPNFWYDFNISYKECAILKKDACYNVSEIVNYSSNTTKEAIWLACVAFVKTI